MITYLHSLWRLSGPSNRFGSALVWVMACCLMAPSHYLKQCWLTIKNVLWHICAASDVKQFMWGFFVRFILLVWLAIGRSGGNQCHGAKLLLCMCCTTHGTPMRHSSVVIGFPHYLKSVRFFLLFSSYCYIQMVLCQYSHRPARRQMMT